ncbi:hypothetical protein FQV39_04035 [Bosea sp. F3-2]|uniref:hypothetical protein n=1 Tax=Bosea sp. F3-2 TaxID=2599640 RepID=UPI0011EC9B1B|nr:hypothetical protein [Bosea sp. F3-2]QEL21836.1 hypothetical protein FQV39_04035 [Bosea sp. F3-2]
MASRQPVGGKGIAGLQRTARLAGECFGHEDVVSAALTDSASSRWLWWIAAIAASAGLVALHFY